MRNWRRTHRRVLLTGITSLIAALAFSGLVLLPSSASATPLVDDYPAYLKAKPRDALVDPWNFYSRECVSFVAWRLTNDNKVPFTNNWRGAHFGNAYEWGAAAKQLGFPVNATPTVGAVAWWDRSTSRFGHVAWVAKVYADKSILIEEYNYVSAGNYSQRRLYRGNYNWPTAFLHIGNVPVTNTTAPSVPVAPVVGAAVTANRGAWSSSTALTYKYAWLANGAVISGAVAQSYTPTPAMLGKKLAVRVTGTAPGSASKTVTSTASNAVGLGTLKLSGTPVVSGTSQVGTLMTAQAAWSPAPARTYQWIVDGVAVQGATAATYSPTPDQVGGTVSAVVTATATGYKVAKTTIASPASVAPGQFTVSQQPTINGVPTVGTALSASPGSWSPKATFTYQWMVGTSAIKGATASSYTPSPSVLGKSLRVNVTGKATGYTTRTLAANPTAAVAPGVFSAGALADLPAPVVGTPMMIDPGTITGTTKPGVTYQWMANGVAIPGATSATYTPVARDVDKQLSVSVTAAAPGYTTLIRTTDLSVAVQMGTFTASAQPSMTGTPRYGVSYRYTPTRWSATPDKVTYQWYSNGQMIAGATSSTYTPKQADVGNRLTLLEVVTKAGYKPSSIMTMSPTYVWGGTASLDAPARISGTPLVGSLLTARAGAPTPSDGTVTVQWLRDGAAISRATAWTYRLTTADIGHRVAVRVSVVRALWTSGSSRSAPTVLVRSPGHITAQVKRLANGTVRIVATITAPGVSAPAGQLGARWGGKLLRRMPVANGRVTFDVRAPSGAKTLNLVFGADRRINQVWLNGVMIR